MEQHEGMRDGKRFWRSMLDGLSSTLLDRQDVTSIEVAVANARSYMGQHLAPLNIGTKCR